MGDATRWALMTDLEPFRFCLSSIQRFPNHPQTLAVNSIPGVTSVLAIALIIAECEILVDLPQSFLPSTSYWSIAGMQLGRRFTNSTIH